MCVRFSDGWVKCWGDNIYGQLGLGDTGQRGSAARHMGAALPYVQLGTGRTALQLAGGGNFVCALLDTYQVKCWGNNGFGQLGLGDTVQRGSDANQMGDNLPVVQLGSGRSALQVAASNSAACALLDNSQVKCWGNNAIGQLGAGDTLPRGSDPTQMGDGLPSVNLGTGVVAQQVAGMNDQFCVVLEGGAVKCWGPNFVGQLGQGDTSARGASPGQMGDALAGVPVGTGRNVMAAYPGWDHTCVRLDDQNTKCWGYNNLGQTGTGEGSQHGGDAGTMGDALPIVQVGTGSHVIDLAADKFHTCAVLDTGEAKCWGGQNLGYGDTLNRGSGPNQMGDALPAVLLGTGRTARGVAVGNGFNCALLDNQQAKCWGSNSYGQLGIGDILRRGDALSEMGDALPYVLW